MLHDTVLVDEAKEAVDIDMGAIVVNSRVALWLMSSTSYAPVAGEALPLMSHNGLGIAAAATFAMECREALFSATVACGMTLVGFEGDISPFSRTVLDAMPKTNHARCQRQCSAALVAAVGHDCDQAGRGQGNRLLQDPLSLRCVSVVHGSALLAVEALEAAIEHSVNTSAPNPLVNSHGCDGSAVVTNPNFDCIAVRLAVDHLRLAMAEVGSRSHSRFINMVDPNQNSGLHFRIQEAGGAHNRNIVNIAAATCAALVRESTTAASSPCRVAEGVEDVTTGLSPALRAAHSSTRHLNLTLALEFLVAWEAVAHKQALFQSQARVSLRHAMTGLPAPLRQVASSIPEDLMAVYDGDSGAFALGQFANAFRQACQAAGGAAPLGGLASKL